MFHLYWNQIICYFYSMFNRRQSEPRFTTGYGHNVTTTEK